MLISSFGLALFNSGSVVEGFGLAQGMGVMYSAIAIGMLGYAWVMQERRRKRIMLRFAGHHGMLIFVVLTGNGLEFQLTCCDTCVFFLQMNCTVLS